MRTSGLCSGSFSHAYHTMLQNQTEKTLKQTKKQKQSTKFQKQDEGTTTNQPTKLYIIPTIARLDPCVFGCDPRDTLPGQSTRCARSPVPRVNLSVAGRVGSDQQAFQCCGSGRVVSGGFQVSRVGSGRVGSGGVIF